MTITAVHKPGQPWAYTTAETVLEPDDVILITGSTDKGGGLQPASLVGKESILPAFRLSR